MSDFYYLSVDVTEAVSKRIGLGHRGGFEHTFDAVTRSPSPRSPTSTPDDEFQPTIDLRRMKIACHNDAQMVDLTTFASHQFAEVPKQDYPGCSVRDMSRSPRFAANCHPELTYAS